MDALARTVAVVAALALPATAAAQDYTVYAVGAVDGNDANLQLTGISVRPSGHGWKPVGSLQVYRLGYPSGTGDVTVWSVTPAVGIGYRAPIGSVEAKVGYAFQEDEGNDILFFDAGGGGVKSSLQANYWGSEPELQGLASYGWEDNSLYSQAQATYAIANLNPGKISVGGEVAWQGDISDSEEYRALQVGPVLRWSSGEGLISALSGGMQETNFDDTWYLKLLFVYSP